jgi:glycosyltransferase involved in cell wall biosynthesis
VKVVHICNAPLTPDHPDCGRVVTHPGRWTINLAKAQRKHCGIAAELLVQVPGTHREHVTEIESVPVHYVAAPDKFRSATLFQLDAARLARRARALGPNIVHGHGTEDAYSLAAQQTGLPNIITAQGLFFLINRKVKPPLLSRQRAVEFTEWLAFKRARHVIAKSNYVAEALEAQFPHLILHAIPNTFDERLLAIDEAKRPNSLVYVGTISPWKGIHILRDALVQVRCQIPEVSLDVAGNATNGASPYEVEQRRLLGEILGDRVVFHGQLDLFDLGRLVASSIAIVAPSLEDMFGNQVVESLLVRTHAIVAEGTALAENVSRFGNGTVVPTRDPGALAKAIIKAVTEPISAAKAEQGRDAIAAAFGPANVAQLHYEVYQQVLMGR